MKKGETVFVSFTGRVSETKMVFETTSEKTAKESGFVTENREFKHVPVIIGNNELLPGLEEALLEMNEGETRHLELPAQKAFGERKKELIAVVPLQQFRKEKINPIPGLIVEINGRPAKVQTVSGGRVRVDFNSELAGKKVEYELKIEKHVTDPKEKAVVLAEKMFPFREKTPKVQISGDELELVFEMELPKSMDVLKGAFEKIAKESIKEIKKVKFTEKKETTKPKEKEEKEVTEKNHKEIKEK